MATLNVYFICHKCVEIDGDGDEELGGISVSGNVDDGDIVTVYCERGHEIRAVINVTQIDEEEEEFIRNLK